jgi:hypothetical protein
MNLSSRSPRALKPASSDALLALLATLASWGFLVGCSSSANGYEGWTVRQAESVDVIRGMRVNVKGCRGIGAKRSNRFHQFDCVAGARLPRDAVETVAVLYELRPVGPYSGARSRYVLENVRFLGGPGIP